VLAMTAMPLMAILVWVGILAWPGAASARPPEVRVPEWATLRVIAASWEPQTGTLKLEATVTASGTAILSADISVCWPGQCIAIGTTGANLGRIEAGATRQRAFAVRARVGVEGFVDFALEARPDIAGLQKVAAGTKGLGSLEREILRREIAGMTKPVSLGRSFALTLTDDLAALQPAALIPVTAGVHDFWVWAPAGKLGVGALAAAYDRYRAALASPAQAMTNLDALLSLVAGAEASMPLIGPGPMTLQVDRGVIQRLLAMNRAGHQAMTGDAAGALTALKALLAAPADHVTPFIHANVGVVHLRGANKFAAADAWRHALNALPAWPGVRHRLEEISR